MRKTENLSHDFFSLEMRPSLNVPCYNGCIIGGVRFHTSECDSRRTIKYSGVMVIGESNVSGSGDNNFYGVLDEVLHVQFLMGRSVWLFNFQWYDTNINKSQRTHVELRYKAINTSCFWFTEKHVILAM